MTTVTAETGVSVSQAARRLGRSESTVRLWLREGKLHAVRTALGSLIDPDDLEEAVQARSRAASTTA